MSLIGWYLRAKIKTEKQPIRDILSIPLVLRHQFGIFRFHSLERGNLITWASFLNTLNKYLYYGITWFSSLTVHKFKTKQSCFWFLCFRFQRFLDFEIDFTDTAGLDRTHDLCRHIGSDGSDCTQTRRAWSLCGKGRPEGKAGHFLAWIRDGLGPRLLFLRLYP